MPYLTEDIKSSCKPSHYYGYKGEEVSIVSDEHGNVVIVENLEGNIYPVPADKLSSIDSKISQHTIVNTEKLIVTPVEVKKTRKTSTSQIPSLF